MSEKIELLTDAINRLSDVFYETQEQKAIIERLKKQVDDANKTLMRCLIVKKTPVQDVVEPYLIRWGIIKK